jgi:WD40 repeat protein
MLITGIDHLQISAPRGSEERVRAFYGGVLGLKEIPKPETLKTRGGLWYDCGNLQLHIGLDDDPDNARSRRHVAFRVEDLDAVRAALNTNGHAIEEDSAPLEGARRFYCRDTVGNRVEFIQWQMARPASAGLRLLPRPELIETYSLKGSPERVALSPDGKWLAAGTASERDVRDEAQHILIWRYGSAGDPEVQIEMSGSVWELAFSPDGKYLVGLTDDGSLETWRTGDFESADFADLPESSSGLAFSVDGKWLAVGAQMEVGIFQTGLRAWTSLRPSSLGLVNALAFDSGDMLAVSGQSLFIQLWQLKPIQQSAWELRGHDSPVTQMGFNPVHPRLAALTEEGRVFVWDTNGNPEEPEPLPEASGDVNAIAFSPEGGVLACGDESGRVRLWDWQTRRVVGETEPASAAILSLAFSPDGAQVIAGCEDGQVRVWRIA